MTEELFDNPPNVRPMTAADVTVVKQEFERGAMYWFAPEQSDENGFIFVLMDIIDRWFRVEDTWGGMTEPAVEPPPGLITPGGGFGNIWFQQPKDHPDFLAILGFALFGESETSGYYRARGDGWELCVTGAMIHLPASKVWRPDAEPAPEPEPEPEPGPEPVIPIPAPELKPGGWWVYLSEIKLAINMDYVAWIYGDSLRVGQYDAVLALPEKTAMALLAYARSLCVKII